MAKDVVVKLIGDSKDFLKTLDTTSKGLADWSKGFTDVGKKAGIAFAGVAAAMGVVGGRALKLAGELEQQKVAFKALLGSAEAADKVISRIQKEAARTPFEFSGLSSMTQQLATITKDGDKAVDILMSVGDAIATSGKDITEMERVVLNLQQVAATGKVTAMDIRQFQGAVPIFNDILKASGLTTQKLQDSKDAASLLFAAFQKASQEGGMTFGGLINQSTTFNGLVSTLKDNFDATFREIGQVLLPDMKKLAIALSDIAGRIAAFVKEHPGIVKVVGAFVLLVTALLGVVSAIGFVGGAVLNGIVVLKQLVGVIKLVDLASKAAFLTNPIGLVIMGVIALIAVGYLLIKNWEKVKDFFVGIFNFIKANSAKIGDVLYQAFTNPIGLIIKAFQKLMGFFGGIFKKLTGGGGGKVEAPTVSGGGGGASAISSPVKAAKAMSTGDSGGGGGAVTSSIGGAIPTSGVSDEGLKKFMDAVTMTADEANAKFLEIGQSFTDNIVTGILEGTLSMEEVWSSFTLNLADMWLNQMMMPITVGMSELSNSMTTIFNQTIGQFLNPIMDFVGQAIGAIGKMFANFILQTLGFQKIFTLMTTGMKMAWDFLTNNMITQWLINMALAAASTISAAISMVWAWAMVAAAAAFASAAAIPIIGWILGPLAYIATMALMIGGPIAVISGLAEGSPGLEEDGVHQFSKGEIVVPETFSDGIKSGDLTLGKTDSEPAPQNNVNVSLSGANFNGSFDDDMAMGIGQQIATAIQNNVMAPMPA